MKKISNVLWFVSTGFEMGIMWILGGIVWCITIIGISFGKQCFKIGLLTFRPFGTVVNKDFGKHPIANIIWIIFGGLLFSAVFAFIGLLRCITIIGISSGKQCFKLAGLALAPFGATIEEQAKERQTAAAQ